MTTAFERLDPGAGDPEGHVTPGAYAGQLTGFLLRAVAAA